MGCQPNGGPPPEYYDEYWTEYHTSLPSAWVGRGIAFSRDGANWTSFRLFNGDDPNDGSPQRIEIEESEWGQRTIRNPDDYSTDAGNRLRLGAWWNDVNRSVFTFSCWDNANEYWPCIGMDSRASTANAYWRWFHPTEDDLSTQLVMVIDPNHRLFLRGRGTDRTIMLDPDSNRITIDGQEVLTKITAPNTLLERQGDRAKLGAGTLVYPVNDPALGGQLVLGKFNDDRSNDNGTDHRRGALIVGAGTGPGSRSNGLRILEDGTVLIWPRGGLQMNEFQDGPTP